MFHIVQRVILRIISLEHVEKNAPLDTMFLILVIIILNVILVAIWTKIKCMEMMNLACALNFINAHTVLLTKLKPTLITLQENVFLSVYKGHLLILKSEFVFNNVLVTTLFQTHTNGFVSKLNNSKLPSKLRFIKPCHHIFQVMEMSLRHSWQRLNLQ